MKFDSHLKVALCASFLVASTPSREIRSQNSNKRHLRSLGTKTLDYQGEIAKFKECEGDCDFDSDCYWGLNCFQREGIESVPGCFGIGESGIDYCFIPPGGYLVISGDHGIPASAYPLQECQGNCITDYDCDLGLKCYQRDGIEPVPGCNGNGNFGTNYCHKAQACEFVIVGSNGVPDSAYPLKECQADCEKDRDCDWGLVCLQRDGDEPVDERCHGSPLYGEDYCVKPSNGTLVEMGNDNEPSEIFPLGFCEGDCDHDEDCADNLVCFLRDGTELVHGCDGSGRHGVDYCYDPQLVITLEPTSPPTSPPINVTYVPGEATVHENGLLLSTGLTCRIIATKGSNVQYDTGGQSNVDFHSAPDGAAVFEDPTTGGWIYVSNSESNVAGGVGAITFDAAGQVIGYKRILTGTTRNCGGGKTPWNTWLSCEEKPTGQVYEVDPFGNSPNRMTKMGGNGMAYESAAYDNRDPNNPVFFLTVDDRKGPLIKYTPSPQAVSDALNSGNYSNLLHDNYGEQKYEYFVVTSMQNHNGTFEWSTSLEKGQDSAFSYHQSGEGIDVRDGELFYTTKKHKLLFTINLDNMTFTRSSTVSGAFDGQPDQVARVLDFSSGGTGNTDDILYFVEDGGYNAGVHGRDSNGNFFTILQYAGNDLFGETTGLAFSPNGIFMYVSFQSPGHIFEIKRTDGLPFQGALLDIKYHADEDNANPFRYLFEDNHKSCALFPPLCIEDDFG